MTSQLPRFRWVFFATGSWEKDSENGAAVTSLRSFLFLANFINLDNFEKLWILDQCEVPVISGKASPVTTKYLNSIMEAAIETIAPDDAHCAQSPAGMLLIIRPFCSISFAFALASPFLLQGKYSEMLLPMISKHFELSYY